MAKSPAEEAFARLMAEKPRRASSNYDPIIEEAAKAHGVDPDLVRRVVRAESGGNTRAVSPKGARGLMQLMPDTARGLGVKNPDDPRENIFGGVKYLRQQLDAFGGDEEKALAAYNAGPGNVRKYGGVPPFRETQAYVAKIRRGRLASRGGSAKRELSPAEQAFAELTGAAPAAASPTPSPAEQAFAELTGTAPQSAAPDPAAEALARRQQTLRQEPRQAVGRLQQELMGPAPGRTPAPSLAAPETPDVSAYDEGIRRLQEGKAMATGERDGYTQAIANLITERSVKLGAARPSPPAPTRQVPVLRRPVTESLQRGEPALPPRPPARPGMAATGLTPAQAERKSQPSRNEFDPFTGNVREPLQTAPDRLREIAGKAAEGVATFMGFGGSLQAAQRAREQYQQSTPTPLRLSKDFRKQAEQVAEIAQVRPHLARATSPHLRAFREAAGKLPYTARQWAQISSGTDSTAPVGESHGMRLPDRPIVSQEEYDRRVLEVVESTLRSLDGKTLAAQIEAETGQKLTPLQRQALGEFAKAERLKVLHEHKVFDALTGDTANLLTNYAVGLGTARALGAGAKALLGTKFGQAVAGKVAGSVVGKAAAGVRGKVSPVIREAIGKTLNPFEHLGAGVSEATITAIEQASDPSLKPEERKQQLIQAFWLGAGANLGIEAVMQGFGVARHLIRGRGSLRAAEVSRMLDESGGPGPVADPELTRLERVVERGQAKGARFGVTLEHGLVEIGAAEADGVAVRPLQTPGKRLTVAPDSLREFRVPGPKPLPEPASPVHGMGTIETLAGAGRASVTAQPAPPSQRPEVMQSLTDVLAQRAGRTAPERAPVPEVQPEPAPAPVETPPLPVDEPVPVTRPEEPTPGEVVPPRAEETPAPAVDDRVEITHLGNLRRKGNAPFSKGETEDILDLSDVRQGQKTLNDVKRRLYNEEFRAEAKERGQGEEWYQPQDVQAKDPELWPEVRTAVVERVQRRLETSQTVVDALADEGTLDAFVNLRREWEGREMRAVQARELRAAERELKGTADDPQTLVDEAFGGAKDREGYTLVPDHYTEQDLREIYAHLTRGERRQGKTYVNPEGKGRIGLGELLEMRRLPPDAWESAGSQESRTLRQKAQQAATDPVGKYLASLKPSKKKDYATAYAASLRGEGETPNHTRYGLKMADALATRTLIDEAHARGQKAEWRPLKDVSEFQSGAVIRSTESGNEWRVKSVHDGIAELEGLGARAGETHRFTVAKIAAKAEIRTVAQPKPSGPTLKMTEPTRPGMTRAGSRATDLVPHRSRLTAGKGRGRTALEDRITHEVEHRGLAPEVGEAAREFLRLFPDKYLSDLGSHYYDGARIPADLLDGETNATGFYSPVDAIFGIAREGVSTGKRGKRVAPHEIGHHLENFVPPQDYADLRNAYAAEKAKQQPRQQRKLETLERQRDAATDPVRKARLEAEIEDLRAQGYRYESFHEWFAENLVDRGLRDLYPDDPATRTLFQRVVRTLREVLARVETFLTGRQRTDLVEQVYRKLRRGEYDPISRYTRQVGIQQYGIPSGAVASTKITVGEKPAARKADAEPERTANVPEVAPKAQRPDPDVTPAPEEPVAQKTETAQTPETVELNTDKKSEPEVREPEPVEKPITVEEREAAVKALPVDANPDGLVSLANAIKDARVQTGSLGKQPTKGQTFTSEESLALGKKAIDEGRMDPEALADELAGGADIAITPERVGVLTHGAAKLQAKVDDLFARRTEAEQAGNKPLTRQLSKDLELAQAALDNYMDKIHAPINTAWHNIGQAIRGVIELDTGSYAKITATLKRERGLSVEALPRRKREALESTSRVSKDANEAKAQILAGEAERKRLEQELAAERQARAQVEAEAKAEVERLRKEAEAEVARARAEGKKQAELELKTPKGDGGNERIREARRKTARREAIAREKAALREEFKQVKIPTMQSVVVGGVNLEDIRNIPRAGKLARRWVAVHIEEGLLNLDDILEGAVQEFRKHGIFATHADILAAYLQKERKLSPTAEQIRQADMRAEARERKRLLDKLEGRAPEPKTPRPERKVSEGTRKLRKQVKEAEAARRSQEVVNRLAREIGDLTDRIKLAKEQPPTESRSKEISGLEAHRNYLRSQLAKQQALRDELAGKAPEPRKKAAPDLPQTAELRVKVAAKRKADAEPLRIQKQNEAKARALQKRNDALDAQIADLQQQIDTGELKPDKTRQPNMADPRRQKLAELKAERNKIRRLQQEISGTLPERKTPAQVEPSEYRQWLTTQAKSRRAYKKALADVERLADLRQQLESGDLKPVAGKGPVSRTAVQQEIADLSRRLAAFRRNQEIIAGTRPAIQKRGLRNPFALTEAEQRAQIAASVKRYEAELAEWERRLAAKDYAGLEKQARKLDDAVAEVKARADLAREQVYRAMEDAAPPTFGKVLGRFYNHPRSQQASLDLSALGRQGWKLALSHPQVAAKAFAEQLKALKSPTDAAKARNEVMARPNAKFYRMAKWDTGASVASFAEEQHLNSAYPGWRKYNPFAASDRAFGTFLLRQRADVFDLLWSRTQNKTEENAQALIMMINVSSGRGLTGNRSVEQAAATFAQILYSPRNASAAIEYLALRPLYSGGDAQVKGLILQEYLRTAAVFVIGVAILKTAGAQINTEDRDATDYLRLKVGNRYIDLTSQLGQVVTLIERIRTGEKTSLSGRTVNMREDEFGVPPAFNEVLTFVRNKFHPVLGVAANLIDGKAVGKPEYNWMDALWSLYVPLGMQSATTAAQEGLTPDDAVLTLEALGAGVTDYRVPEKRKREPGFGKYLPANPDKTVLKVDAELKRLGVGIPKLADAMPVGEETLTFTPEVRTRLERKIGLGVMRAVHDALYLPGKDGKPNALQQMPDAAKTRALRGLISARKSQIVNTDPWVAAEKAKMKARQAEALQKAMTAPPSK
jgi:hypothetical protein